LTVALCMGVALWVSAGARAFVPTVEKQVITLPLSKAVPAVDGTLAAGEYGDAVVLGGSFKGWGVSPRPQSPTVWLKRTADRLFIALDNPLKEGERPSMRGAVPDNPGIALNNAIELFFLPHLPPGELLQYMQFIGNARGCVYDAISRPQVGVTYVAEFNRPWLYRNRVVPGHWFAEISCTFADINVSGTANGEWFDFDVGRDGGTGPKGVHSYAMAYHLIQTGMGVRVVFDDEAPAAQWLSFGDFEQARFNPHLRLVGQGRADTLTVEFVVTGAEKAADGAYPGIFRETRQVALAADGAVDVQFDRPLDPKSKGIAHYRISDKDGKVLFLRELPFTTNNEAPPLYPQAVAQPLVVTARTAPSYGRIEVTADIIDYPGDRADAVVDAVVTRDGRELGRARLDRFTLDFASGIVEVGSLAPGECTVLFQILGRGSGKPLGPTAEVKLTRTVYPWEGNQLGISDRVPEPWTPVEVTGGGGQGGGGPPAGTADAPGGDKAFKARVWGREYAFSGLALPASILTRQPNPARGPEVTDVLAGPVRVVAEVDGRVQAWEEGRLARTAASDLSVALAGTGHTPSLGAEVTGTLDYDGFYTVTLTLTPKDATAYTSIRVEVPVPSAAARLFHCVGESMRTNKTFADFAESGEGVLWDSKAAACNSLVQGNFLPVAWLGDEDRGIAWQCDNDRTWQTTFDKPCLDVVRQGGETVFRMHLLNAPGVLRAPIHVTFGLQATPVRPRPPGGSWKPEEWYGWGHFDMPLIYHGAFDAYAKGELPPNGPWYRTPEARAQNRWWRYGCFNSDRIAETDATYGGIIRDFGAEWYSESVISKYQNRAHQDFELWAWKQWQDQASCDGVYFDNTYPAPCTNVLNGSAWTDEQGRLRPGYGVMGYRDFMKRLRTMLLEFGPAPVLKAHTTDTPIPGYLGFCDFWMDGENGGYPDPTLKDPDFVDRWYNPTGMANLRVSLGQQWGAIPQYLYSWGVEPTHAVLGLFDLVNEYRGMGRAPYHEFGRHEADVRYIPYWAAVPVARVTAGGPDVLVTAWQRPRQARVMLSNLSGDDRAVSVKVDLAALGLSPAAVALDEREGRQLAMEEGEVGGLRIPRHDYTYLIVAEPGVHQPLPPDFGHALRPDPALWVPALCDDFAALSPDWQPHASVNIAKATHSAHGVPSQAFDLFSGHLRIRTGSYIYASLRRPFGQDSCSVQVKIREPDHAHGGGFGPGLHLYWADGRSVHLAAWEQGPGHPLHCRGVRENKPVFTKSGPPPAKISWVRITLKPDAIEFHTSTDATTWELLHAQPRAGFEGAPETLALGHGVDRDGPLEGTPFDSYFDDLITAKLEMP